MPDNKTKRGAPDRRLAAGQQQYVVLDFERKHGLTTDEARERTPARQGQVARGLMRSLRY